MLERTLTLSSRRSVPISVVIPVYNGAAFLAEALRSVEAQTIRPEQILVIDDGSTDDSAAVAKAFAGVEVIRQENRGAGAARNLGLEHTQNEWIAFLDADDVWYPQRLELQVTHLKESSVDFSFGHVQTVRMLPGGTMQAASQLMPAPYATTFLGHRRHFETIGKFAEEYCLVEFIEWMTRATDAGLRYEILPQALAMRRLHENNSGVRQHDRRSDYARMLRDVIQRRRRLQAADPSRCL